jgi:hypothetical protein
MVEGISAEDLEGSIVGVLAVTGKAGDPGDLFSLEEFL